MKTKKILITAIAALFSAAFMSGCKDEKVGKIGQCPTVISTSPANLATNVPLDKIVTVTFNEAMDPATITPAAFTLLSPGSPGGRSDASTRVEMSGTLTYDAATFTMSFTPSSKLAPNALYTGTVGTSIKDAMGNALQTPYIWTFNTGANSNPNVTSTDPLSNALNVPLTKLISATFSVAMDPLTITTSTFTVKLGSVAVAGAVSYSGTTATFTPSSNLVLNNTYSATITTGAKNLAGNALTSNYVWTFSTGASAVPTVLSTDPLDLATGVPLNKVITGLFSEAMDPLTVTSSTFTLAIGVTPVAGVVTYSGTTATFTPTSNLLSSTSYTATFTTGVKILPGLHWRATTFGTLALLLH